MSLTCFGCDVCDACETAIEEEIRDGLFVAWREAWCRQAEAYEGTGRKASDEWIASDAAHSEAEFASWYEEAWRGRKGSSS